MNYKKIKETKDAPFPTQSIIRTEDRDGNPDKVCIPFDDENTEYIEYKAWLAKGNKPEDA